MSAELKPRNRYNFDERLAIADTLASVYSDEPTAQDFFFTVLLPNLIPESFPERYTRGATWIGELAAGSLARNKHEIGRKLMALSEVGALDPDCAETCADVLGLPFAAANKGAEIIQLPVARSQPSKDLEILNSDSEAKIYYFGHKRVS